LPNETEIDSQVVKTEKCQLEEKEEDLSRRKKVFFKMYGVGGFAKILHKMLTEVSDL
jgi:hypothetical protein